MDADGGLNYGRGLSVGFLYQTSMFNDERVASFILPI